jgi:5-methylcytosine-specific restriction endonuclease McrA
MLFDMGSKYTKEMLEEAAVKCVSYLGMVKYFGMKPHGGTATYLRDLCKRFEIDCSHFLGQHWSKGQYAKKRTAEEVLVRRDGGSKDKTRMLRWALLKIGRPLVCQECGNPPVWNGKPLTLQVDHADGDTMNNLPENLRFLCPNCHSQTDTFGRNNVKPQK